MDNFDDTRLRDAVQSEISATQFLRVRVAHRVARAPRVPR
jgi:hypothetical protein